MLLRLWPDLNETALCTCVRVFRAKIGEDCRECSWEDEPYRSSDLKSLRGHSRRSYAERSIEQFLNFKFRYNNKKVLRLKHKIQKQI